MNLITRIGRPLSLLFGITILVDLAAAAADASLVLFIHLVQAGVDTSDATAVALDTFQSITAISQLIVLIPTAVLFLIWFYRSHKNLEVAGVAGLKYSSASAVWSFFVPLLNLFRPQQIMKEVEAGTWRLTEESPSSPPSETTSKTIGLWWGLFVTSGLASRAASQLVSGSAVSQILFGEYLFLASDLASAGAAYFALRLVGSITRAQARALAGVQGGPTAA